MRFGGLVQYCQIISVLPRKEVEENYLKTLDGCYLREKGKFFLRIDNWYLLK